MTQCTATTQRTAPSTFHVAASLTAFDADEAELLRAVQLATVMSTCGRVLSSNQGSLATYSLSRPVHQIDLFISHNWCISRARKFSALACHFNFEVAAASAVFFTCLLAALQVIGVGRHSLQVTVMDRPSGLLCRWLGVPMFFLVLYWLRDVLLHACDQRGPTAFLDKCCIHQVDVELMARGIRKLGAFIGASDDMLVLYSDKYLFKLWTIYEVAAFLTLRSGRTMIIVPIFQSTVLCVAVLVTYLIVVVDTSLRLCIAISYPLCLEIPGAVVYVLVLRTWVRQRLAIEQHLLNFTVKSCTCAVESDRPLVYSNIARLMRATQRLELTCSEEEALSAFDVLVRQTLPAAFAPVLQTRRTYQGYRYYLFLGFTANGCKTLDAFAAIAYGTPFRQFVPTALEFLLWTTTLWPIVFLIADWLSWKAPHLTGAKELVFVIITVLICGTPTIVLYFLLRRLTYKAMDAELIVLVVYCLLNVAGAFITSRLSLPEWLMRLSMVRLSKRWSQLSDIVPALSRAVSVIMASCRSSVQGRGSGQAVLGRATPPNTLGRAEEIEHSAEWWPGRDEPEPEPSGAAEPAAQPAVVGRCLLGTTVSSSPEWHEDPTLSGWF